MTYYMWWAIESFYPGYWGKLDNMLRYELNLAFGMRKNELIVYLSSLIVGFNMEYYFERFVLTMDHRFLNTSNFTEVYKKQLQKATKEKKIKSDVYKKLWYADNLQYNFSLSNGSGCYKDDNNYEIKITDINKDESSGINLTFGEVNCPAHLGFEIIENDIVIGFTTKNSFVDQNKYDIDYKPKYKIIAYDRLLDTKESDYINFE